MLIRRLVSVGMGALLAATVVAGPASAASRPITPEFFGVQDDLVRPMAGHAWGSARLWAAWCTVQPRAGMPVGPAAEQALGRQFGVFADAGVSRLTLSLGHPAPWVFGDHPRAVAKKTERVWFCGQHASVTSFPTASSLKSGPVRDAYSQYVAAVIAAARPYLDANPANKLVLQAWNEPNLLNGGTVTHRIPGSARTWKQASDSLRAQERIIRQVARATIPGRFEVTSPSLYGKRTALNTAYFKDQARSRTVDSFSINFYTLRQKSVNKSLSLWRSKASTAQKLITRHRSLKKVPIWITETNHNLINGIPDQGNVTGFWATPAVQKRLVEVTTMEALRKGFAGIQWYQGTDPQTAVRTLTGTPATEASAALRAELEGRQLVRCTTKRSRTTCSLTARAGSGPIKVTWSAKGSAGVTILR
jgi:hypothetical protein